MDSFTHNIVKPNIGLALAPKDEGYFTQHDP